MALDTIGATNQLLSEGDVPPVHEVNAQGTSPFLLTSDHYGRVLPAALGDLGVAENELTRHIAWDIGIGGVADRLAEMLGAHLIAQRYSRLVIDCNRPPAAVSSIPLISEATAIPRNEGISEQERKARRREIFEPYHRHIHAAIDRRVHDKRPTVLVSLHSFTPVYAGVARPWHIGALYNEPYAVNDLTDYTIPVHGEARGLVNTGIEIRQDLIADQSGQQQWAERLARIFAEIEVELRAERLVD